MRNMFGTKYFTLSGLMLSGLCRAKGLHPFFGDVALSGLTKSMNRAETPKLESISSKIICIYIIKNTIFVHDKTHHASHLNSAPGWVFDLYGEKVLYAIELR